MINISKFFHMFLTALEERKFLGLIHPKTEEHFWYATFPMGTRNSPGTSRHFGKAFMHMLREGCPHFHRKAQHNNFLFWLDGRPFDPGWGTG